MGPSLWTPLSGCPCLAWDCVGWRLSNKRYLNLQIMYLLLIVVAQNPVPILAHCKASWDLLLWSRKAKKHSPAHNASDLILIPRNTKTKVFPPACTQSLYGCPLPWKKCSKCYLRPLLPLPSLNVGAPCPELSFIHATAAIPYHTGAPSNTRKYHHRFQLCALI